MRISVNPYGALLRRLGPTRAFAWIGSRTLHRIDRRFAFTALGTGLPLCYLTVTGCKSDQPRTVPNLYAPADGDGIVLSAGNWGAPRTRTGRQTSMRTRT